MNRLSLAARTMLGRHPRRHTITEPEAIIQQITRAGAPVFEPVVAFQAQYGGMTYAVRSEAMGFSFDLFARFMAIDPTDPVTYHAEKDRWFFYCGKHTWDPFFFYIAPDGAICVDADNYRILPIASSVEKYIESHAIRDELLDIQTKWWELSFQVAAANRDVAAVFAQGRRVVDVASDAYTTWWVDEHSRIARFLMYDTRTFNQVTAYFTSRGAAVQFAEAVRAALDGSSLDVLPSPFEIKEHRASAAYGG
jgi:hypothetical protein